MGAPKFASSAAVANANKPAAPKRKGRPPGPGPKKTDAEAQREQRARKKGHVQAVKPSILPAKALTTLTDAWTAAQAAQLAGTAIESPTAQLILEHLGRTEDRPRMSASARAIEIIGNEADDKTATKTSQDILVGRHRTDIAETRRIVMGLIAELDFAMKHEGLFDLIAAACSDNEDSTVVKKNFLRNAVNDLLSLPGRVDMALKLGNTLRALVPLERQAAGLPDGYVDAATQRAQKESLAEVALVATSFDAIRGRFDQIVMRAKKGDVVAP